MCLEYNTGPLFYRLKLMTIKDLYEYSSGIYIYKSVNRLLPTIFWNEFTLSKTNRYLNNLQHIYYIYMYIYIYIYIYTFNFNSIIYFPFIMYTYI